MGFVDHRDPHMSVFITHTIHTPSHHAFQNRYNTTVTIYPLHFYYSTSSDSLPLPYYLVVGPTDLEGYDARVASGRSTTESVTIKWY